MGSMIELADNLTAYRAEPVGEVRGGLVLIHEIWGLVAHITDVADRFAAEGYLVLAPDILGPTGVSAEVGDELQRLLFNSDEKTRTEAQPILREKLAPSNAPEYAAWAVGALRSAVDYLDAQPGVDGRIAVTGFCFGGGYSFALAAADPRVRAAVPFYGYPPTAVDTIGCPVLAFYGDEDERLMTSLPALTATMADAGVTFTAQTYEGAGHAFFNDTNGMTYRPDAAADAFARALAFLRTTLSRD
ncbi:carboxymethylenebutenolidase [Conyzicola lurida]|uniref:Carboxymethylenebutenolidase n=1 Tax=Conyzicola lurida TaxID=1172621 RepID=A0A841AMB3_9MICO|nr:dienelactone hydrolase family protein [Conyzicola lurida]MBB5842773.1 carboxymethylenebutenolidase [Conyzicola lurida]